MNTKIVKLMARFGTLSPVIGVIVVIISISMTPTWSMSQSLTDLGVEGFGSVMFNSGLLMAGSLAMLYGAGLFEFTSGDIFGQLGSASFLVYSIATCILGIAIIDLGDLSGQVYTLLFIAIPLSAGTLAYSLYRKNMTLHAGLAGLAFICGAAPWIMGGMGGAVNELIALVPFALLQLALGYHMYKLEEPVEFD